MKFKDTTIFDHINKFPETPNVFKNIFDYEQILTWKEIEDYLNNSYIHSENLELISNCGSKFYPNKNSYPYSSIETYKTSQIFEFINKNFSFILTNMNRFNPKINEVFNEIENFIDNKILMDFHVYAGLGNECKSFLAHCDKSDNIIIQIDGNCDWKVYDLKFNDSINLMESDESNFNLIIDEKLSPGDCLYIPAGVVHKCSPNNKRMSISCCWKNISNKKSLSIEGVSYRSYIGERKWYTFEN